MIYIVIPVFNRWHFTEQCLLSLRAQTFKKFTTVVIDHGSTDGTRERIIEFFPEVVILIGDETMWWTAATNMGVRYALRQKDAEYVVTLNNDLVVPPDYLLQLVECENNNPKSLIGSVAVDVDKPDNVVFAGTIWNKFTAKYRPTVRISSYSEMVQKFTTLKTDMLPGRGTMIPITAFETVGLYDENNFPHYTADEDFSRRCLNRGYNLIVCTSAIIESYSEATGLAQYKNQYSLLKFIKCFTSIKSPCNLITRWRWANEHAPFPMLYFILDFSRLMFSQLVKSFIKQ